MDENLNRTPPPGALPAEVADDVDIKASEGEYIIPANVVRFLGLDKIEKMVSQAKEKLGEMDANGRIGGAPSGDLPFSPEELQVSEDTPSEAPPMMADGGVVTSPRPKPRPEEQVAPAQRPMTRGRSQEIERTRGDVEFRADLEKQLSSNPIARLGYDPSKVKAMPFSTGDLGAEYLPAGSKQGDINYYYSKVDPMGENSYRANPDNVVLHEGSAQGPIISHEFSHRGLGQLGEYYAEDPEHFENKYGKEAALALEEIYKQGDPKKRNEYIVELFDDLDTVMKSPAGDKTQADYRDRAPESAQRRFQDDILNVKKEDRLAHKEVTHKVAVGLMSAAEDLLSARGEPPKTEPDYPNFFERLAGRRFAEGGMVTGINPTLDPNSTEVDPATGLPLWLVALQNRGQSTPAPAQTTTPSPQATPVAKEESGFDRGPQAPLTGMAASVGKWEPKDFVNYAKSRDSVGQRVGQGLASVVPFGGLAAYARQGYLEKKVPVELGRMVETGKDLQGNDLSSAQLDELKQSYATITGNPLGRATGFAAAAQKVAQETGLIKKKQATPEEAAAYQEKLQKPGLISRITEKLTGGSSSGTTPQKSSDRDPSPSSSKKKSSSSSSSSRSSSAPTSSSRPSSRSTGVTSKPSSTSSGGVERVGKPMGGR